MGKSKKSKACKVPKTECCISKSKCGRCPLRMLKEGTMPDGFTVKKRVVVSTKNGKKASKKDLQKAA
ncbi:hypothetical protein F0U44_00275 [Nocardioides humilatus]|uniref:Uncharacterized protein n=1 Tax=Nocardioides humilatus TaxID=2607660 RepID=A0A5B1LK33_9ACTN|nr:hypothetical protein [Nocardioides humilatus]KAA1420826.1 hypothetical protein F0U44_00275 [Nocardioides humilatus]